MNIVAKAAEFAKEKHKGQKYGSLPYSYHLQKVYDKLLYWRDFSQYEITDTHLAVAWLHDVFEDVTEVTYEVLYDTFGDVIVDSILDLSKNHCHPNLVDYFTRIKQNPIAKLVKMADTTCNLEASLLSGENKRIVKYSKQLALLVED